MKDKNTEYMPDQKWHQIISFVKSAVRIVGFIALPFSLVGGALLLVLAEVLGIVEELV